MRIFKNKWFVRFARKEGITDQQLKNAVAEAEAGKIDANYGGGVIKQRIARAGGGKSGGYRSIILYLIGSRAYFVYGFSKNDKGTLGKDEELYFKKLAKLTLKISDEDISELLENGTYEEVESDE